MQNGNRHFEPLANIKVNNIHEKGEKSVKGFILKQKDENSPLPTLQNKSRIIRRVPSGKGEVVFVLLLFFSRMKRTIPNGRDLTYF